LEQQKKTQDGKGDVKSTNVPKVVNVSSILGSIAKTIGNLTSYSVSKAALNMLTACYAQSVKDIVFIPLHPGWVDTDMGRSGGQQPPLTPAESIKGIISVIAKLNLEQSGKYLQYNGEILPW